jgi:lysophospholipase L1-like esterase
MAPRQAQAVVVLGDSRWPDQLARRLIAARRPIGVLNQGAAGNRVLQDGPGGESGLHRFDRDVLSQSGVAWVIVILGINDLRNRNPIEATAEDMIAGYKQMILRAHARGIKIFGGTLLPFENETFTPGAYTPEGEARRQAVNTWIRTSGAFDAVIDFERALRDPSYSTRLLPEYDYGDHLHPSDAGYRLMGDTIDLALFR